MYNNVVQWAGLWIIYISRSTSFKSHQAQIISYGNSGHLNYWNFPYNPENTQSAYATTKNPKHIRVCFFEPEYDMRKYYLALQYENHPRSISTKTAILNKHQSDYSNFSVTHVTDVLVFRLTRENNPRLPGRICQI